MKPNAFKTVPIKPQGSFASREEYPPGSCVRCYNCGDGRLVSHFPDDPSQTDGVSPFCDRCNTRVRQAIVAHAFAAGPATPTETREQAAARMRRAAAVAAAEVKAASTFDMAPPAEDLSDGPVSDGEEVDAEFDEQDQGETLNSGETTAGARLVIEAEGLDLTKIRGRSGDGKVGMPEIDAWKASQELRDDEENDGSDG